MIIFNKETEYALRGLVYIQSQNNNARRPGIVEIAQEVDAPQFFIAKILQRLVKQGVLKSQKGKGGGFYFDKDAPELSIKNLTELIGSNGKLYACGFGFRHCDASHPCPLHDKYAPIRDSINSLVTDETIQSLARR